MNYLNQLNEKISLFQLISYINIASLFLNLVVSTIFRKTMGVTSSFLGENKKLFESDDEDSSATLVRIHAGKILFSFCGIVISIISFWFGLEFFVRASTVAFVIIPAVDCLPLLTDCYLNGQSYSKDSFFFNGRVHKNTYCQYGY